MWGRTCKEEKFQKMLDLHRRVSSAANTTASAGLSVVVCGYENYEQGAGSHSKEVYVGGRGGDESRSCAAPCPPISVPKIWNERSGGRIDGASASQT